MVFRFLFVLVVQKAYHNFNLMIISSFNIQKYKSSDKYFYRSCKLIWQHFSLFSVTHISMRQPGCCWQYV